MDLVSTYYTIIPYGQFYPSFFLSFFLYADPLPVIIDLLWCSLKHIFLVNSDIFRCSSSSSVQWVGSKISFTHSSSLRGPLMLYWCNTFESFCRYVLLSSCSSGQIRRKWGRVSLPWHRGHGLPKPLPEVLLVISG